MAYGVPFVVFGTLWVSKKKNCRRTYEISELIKFTYMLTERTVVWLDWSNNNLRVIREENISIDFEDHSAENCLQLDLPLHLCSADVEGTPNGDSHLICPGLFDTYPDLNFDLGPFEYDCSIISETNTNLGVVSNLPSLATPSPSPSQFDYQFINLNDPLFTIHSPQNEQQSSGPVLYPPSLAQPLQSAGLSPGTSGPGSSVSSNSVEADNYSCNLHQPAFFFTGTRYREPIHSGVDSSGISTFGNYSKLLPAPARLQPHNGNEDYPSRPKIPSSSPDTLRPGNKRQVPLKLSVRRCRRREQHITCPSCSKAFSRPCDLKKHARTHSRAFRCDIAGCTNMQGFALHKDLRRHIDTLHLKSTFTCHFPSCGNIFSRSDNCLRHFNEQHTNPEEQCPLEHHHDLEAPENTPLSAFTTLRIRHHLPCHGSYTIFKFIIVQQRIVVDNVGMFCESQSWGLRDDLEFFGVPSITLYYTATRNAAPNTPIESFYSRSENDSPKFQAILL
ncbi:hypothetical protein OIDMADRAFT_56369 [Oidiodendron maius Zn]|uniref:C2H2-type domain-containing protein n=1 Tax=Oidiodendron maius (strain Zn) TaxID=913774 RepID=A0A0C3H7I5_OIDMZ|nr:hypothetical protein OIDMADRAFT_56369 [Oidiodendron maius Zn]